MRVLLWASVCALLGCSPTAGPSGIDSSPSPAPERTPAPAASSEPAPSAEPATSMRPPAASAPTPEPAVPPVPTVPVREPTFWSADKGLDGAARMASARKRTEVVEALYADAGLAFPPTDLLFRAFKKEGVLEVWAASEPDRPLVHVTTYRVCAASGQLGPKRAEGDWQVPEGFYELDFFNAQSKFHLSMQVSYPNAADRTLGGANPGGQIMIHGHCRSVGCLAMTDERIEELWVMAEGLRKTGSNVYVHIFPTRDMVELIADPDAGPHHDFWKNLQEGFDLFERAHRIPSVTITPEGRYIFSSPTR